MKRIYVDNASITPTDARVEKEIKKYADIFGNPSSIHAEGVEAKRVMDQARKTCADFLFAHADEIVFTGSGTEANNLAIFGVINQALKAQKIENIHLVVSAIEHPSVLECALELKRRGAKVDIIPVFPNGIVDLAAIKKVITSQTTLVSIMYVNNEIGTIQPITEIAKMIRFVRKNNAHQTSAIADHTVHYPLFHTDASQAPLYLDLHVERLGVDLLTLDAHKVYGPKGIGLLYVKRRTVLEPIVYGGGQEQNRRSGTNNLPSIVGFAKALSIAAAEREAESERLCELRDYCIEALKKTIPNLIINGDLIHRIPNNVNFSVPNVDAEFLVLQLDAQGIACSTKSSCLRDEDESYVIAALGNNDSKNSVRMTFGRDTTKRDVDYILKNIAKLLPLATK